MKSFALIALVGLAVAPLAEAAEFNSLQADKSTLAFVYKQMGVPVEGRFKKFAARISFDPARPAAAKAELDVDLASIDTGSSEGDDEVAGKGWFDTQHFPQAKFVAGGVKALGGNRYEVSGKMSIKGRTRDVTAPFSFSQQGNVGVFDGAFVLKRADYAIGEGEWADFGTVANEIQIKFHFLAGAGK
ncbi:MAG: YceI family protein [Rhodocyclaceae bacterium]|nr:YceI family protein [Rhodocyclaceae bacterium]